MAKELPYFKWEPAQWENGSIQICSHEAKGVFADLCSMYWQRIGDLSYKLAVQKICKGNAVALDSLIHEDVVKVIDGMICIDFLNEQLSEFENISNTNSENARSGWEKRRSNAKAMRPHSDPYARRGEKRREDKKREEENPASARVWLDDDMEKAWCEWIQFRKEIKKPLKPSTIEKQKKFLRARGPDAISIINQSIQNGWTGLFEIKTNNNARGSNKTTSTGVITDFSNANYKTKL